MKKQQRLVMFIVSLFILIMGTVNISIAQEATNYNPAYGGEYQPPINIKVDGYINDWNTPDQKGLPYFFFADMHRAGKSEKIIESKLYLYYDCLNGILYALVLAEPGVTIYDDLPEDSFIKFGNNDKRVDGKDENNTNQPQFAWIRDDGVCIGWEASIIITEGLRSNLNVHTQVFSDGESQTSAVEDRSIIIDIDCDNSLPVELKSFNGEVKGNDVVLTWETASEIENLGFEVFRSSEKDGDYVMIGSFLENSKLKGQGSTTTSHTYSFINKNVNEGIFWYKIADVTYNDVKTFHGPVSANISKQLVATQKIELNQNYPNPFNPSTTFSYEILETGNVQVMVYNMLGEKVRTLISEEKSAGVHYGKWDANDDMGNNLPSGMYILRMKTQNIEKSRTMILMR